MVENFQPVIPPERLLECIHCGLCTSSCPTYLETRNENNSPRGRIQLMRGVLEKKLDLTPAVKEHLDLCLDCRGCETACPSGVKYSQILEPFRHEMERTGQARKKSWWQDLILRYLFPNRNLLWWSVQPAKLMRLYGLTGLLERTGLILKFPPMLQQMLRMLPQGREHVPALENFYPALGKKRARVALFLGCASDALFRDINRLTIKVLQINGCEVLIPQEQTCCGAIAAHSGMLPQALSQAEKNQRVFNELQDVDAIITNVAGCGAQLKEYQHLYHYADSARHLKTEIEIPADHQTDIFKQQPSIDPRLEFGKKVKDISEFLDELGLVEMNKSVNFRVAYHPACHLQHAQKVKTAPHKLLRQIPGIKLVPFQEAEICCGAAGSYNLTEVEMANKLGERKLKNLQKADIHGVITGNIGCMMQMEAQIRQLKLNMWVKHPVELLAAGYGLISIKEEI